MNNHDELSIKVKLIWGAIGCAAMVAMGAAALFFLRFAYRFVTT